MKLPPPANPARYLAALALHVRRFGHCYVHTAAPWHAESDGMTFQVSRYGRSTGNKYKVHAVEGGKPATTKRLVAFLNSHR